MKVHVSFSCSPGKNTFYMLPLTRDFMKELNKNLLKIRKQVFTDHLKEGKTIRRQAMIYQFEDNLLYRKLRALL